MVVIDLTVVRDHVAATMGDHRLMALGGEVDD